jgi:hypothetical protein
VSSEEIREALKALCGARLGSTGGAVGDAAAAALPSAVASGPAPTGAWVDIPPYQSDVLVRGSEALAKTKDGRMTRTVL